MLKITSNSEATVGAGDNVGHVENVSILDRFVKKIRSLGITFFVTVFIPTIVSCLYFVIFASNIYISESRYVVQSPERPSASSLGILLKSVGFSNAGDEIFIAQDYLLSRDALRALDKDSAVKKAFSLGSVSFFDRFGTIWSGSSFEDLYHFYRKKVRVEYQGASSITVLTVRAYTPEDARRLNERLLEMAETMVNRLNSRGRSDLVRYATTDVEDAKRKANVAALSLSQYRNREGVVDPEKQASVQLQMVSKIQDELIATKTQLVQLRAFTPQNPQIPVLQERLRELSREADNQLREVAGDQKSLSSAAAQYQRLALENQFADKQLAAAMSTLEEAKSDARRKQAYVQRVVEPNLPDDAEEPRRWRGVLATFVFGLVLWGVVSMLFSSMMEHRS